MSPPLNVPDTRRHLYMCTYYEPLIRFPPTGQPPALRLMCNKLYNCRALVVGGEALCNVKVTSRVRARPRVGDFALSCVSVWTISEYSLIFASTFSIHLSHTK